MQNFWRGDRNSASVKQISCRHAKGQALKFSHYPLEWGQIAFFSVLREKE